jgi:two-component system phosphate regulon sensor histidine kinase PhoR
MAITSILKNPTPQLVALISSSIIAISTLVVLIICKILFTGMPEWLIVIVATILVFAIGYIVVYSLVERFIYRKIKLVYKSISDTKLSTQDTPLKSNVKDVNLIEDAEAAVLNWQKSKINELNKQKKLDKYRKEFLGNVFHELKTPLFNIQGYLETLIEGGIYDKNVNLKFAKKASKNVNRMAKIVEDLQMIANLQDASFVLAAEKFDITYLVKDIIESMEERAKKKKNKLEIKEGCNQSFTVMADREMIHQVLNNLIINALKYGKESGKTQIGLYDMNENILIEVSDNGIGMDKDQLPRIFERFYRIDKNRSRKLGGTGLGLSIVKHIIEVHNQTINVRSTPGVGSTFGFTLKKA